MIAPVSVKGGARLKYATRCWEGGWLGGDFDGIFPDTQTGQYRGADDIFTCMRATDGGALSF